MADGVPVSSNTVVCVGSIVTVTVGVNCCVVEDDRESVGRSEGDPLVSVSETEIDARRDAEYVAVRNPVCVGDTERIVTEMSSVVDNVREPCVTAADLLAISDAVTVRVLLKEVLGVPRLEDSVVVPE